MRIETTISRRTFLATGVSASVLSATASAWQTPVAPRRPKVAAVFTAFAHRWHAHVILENFLEPYLFRGKLTDPGVDVVSFYADQFPAEDMARDVAREYRIPIYETVAEALTRGGDDLDVDAVLLIGEHGDYPLTEHGVRMYPRKELFDQCVAVMRRTGRSVPMFVDKHLSYRWDWAKQMYDTAVELKIPLMAGSSVPLAEHQPPLEAPTGKKLKQAISIHGGPFEMYDIHGLELLQSMVEARHGGETGVRSVQLLRGDKLWAAAEQGDWDPTLADAALKTETEANHPPLRELLAASGENLSAHGVLVRYVDGLVGMTLRVAGPNSGTRFLYAHRTADDSIEATRCYVGPWQNRNLFKALSHAIQSHFRTGQPPYPVERTLLTTGMTLAAVDSLAALDRAVETPQLAEIKYQPTNWSALRENGESWKILTEAMPEPRGITRGGHAGEKLEAARPQSRFRRKSSAGSG